jgi:hypothetical protein
VAGFVGLSTLVPGEVEAETARTGIGDFPVPDAEAGATLFAVRPECVQIGDNGGVPGKVRSSSFRGDRWLVEVEVSERCVLSWSAEQIETGRDVRVRLDPPPVAVTDDRRSR